MRKKIALAACFLMISLIACKSPSAPEKPTITIRIVGLVTNAGTHAPIANALVQVCGFDFDAAYFTRVHDQTITNSEGRYRINLICNPSPGVLDLIANADGYKRMSMWDTGKPYRIIWTTEIQEVNFQLEPL